MQLVKYENACQELSQYLESARNTDEAKEARDIAVGIEAYARKAKNKLLEADAWEVRVRAERKLGEFMHNGGKERASVGRRWGNGFSENPLPTLTEIGIDKGLAHRARRLWALTYKQFMIFISEGRADVQHAVERSLNSNAARKAAVDRTRMADIAAELTGKFTVLYADPPWRYEHPPMGGGNRSIENHYPTMELEDIIALPIDNYAHDDSVLFLWATSPKLPECLKVMDAWGFTYRTSMVWVKDKIGMGYHAREKHELLLIGKRGELPPPDQENRPDSVIFSPRLQHSAKPPLVRDMIDRMYPSVRKVELFAREQIERENWTYWGNENAGLSS
jgi:N6-adenosine-specific RNA methylase IME4